MKKFFIFAAALATLASCTKNASIEEAPVADDNAIGFSAYTSTPATKGTVEDSSTIVGDYNTAGGKWDAKVGIGVFTFYQPATNGSKSFFNSRNYATPNFMNNQNVSTKVVTEAEFFADYGAYNTAKGTSITADDFAALPYKDKVNTAATYNWVYSPVKYWPNNEGDLLSFFAYAPYDENKKWTDFDIKTDAVASKLTAKFRIADAVAKQNDILWTDPKINQTNKTDANANTLSNKLTFPFKHATSKVDIHIGVAQSSVTTGGATDWDDEFTKITIESIVFKGLYDSFEYVYDIDTKGVLSAAKADYSNASTFDLKVLPCTTSEDKTNASVINNTTWDANCLIKDGTNKNYKKYLDKDEFMFLAPQVFTSETVTITYVVETKVDKTGATSSANDSKITNVITKKLSEILGAKGLEEGVAYNLQFLIGMDDVNISASVADWAEPQTKEIDVPANN